MAVSEPTLVEERQLWTAGASLVAGVDEVGLGCLAGPIVAAAVVMPIDCPQIPRVRDSKTLSFKQRTQLFELIQAQALAIGIGMATVAEIDRHNVLQASYLAMARALARVEPYDYALVDGRGLNLGGRFVRLIKRLSMGMPWFIRSPVPPLLPRSAAIG